MLTTTSDSFVPVAVGLQIAVPAPDIDVGSSETPAGGVWNVGDSIVVDLVVSNDDASTGTTATTVSWSLPAAFTSSEVLVDGVSHDPSALGTGLDVGAVGPNESVTIETTVDMTGAHSAGSVSFAPEFEYSFDMAGGAGTVLGTMSDIFPEVSVTTNRPPSVPIRVTPAPGATVAREAVQLVWLESTDPDSDAVTYQVQLATDEEFTGPQVIEESSSLQTVARAGFGVLTLALAGLSLGRSRRRHLKLLVAVAFVLFLVGCPQPSGPIDLRDLADGEAAAIAEDLEPNTTYWWRVIATDVRGGVSRSSASTFVTNG